jgi:hypothetical protein
MEDDIIVGNDGKYFQRASIGPVNIIIPLPGNNSNELLQSNPGNKRYNI